MIDQRSICIRKQSMSLSDNTIAAEGSADSLNPWAEIEILSPKRGEKKFLNPGRVFENGTNACEHPMGAVLEVKKSHQIGKGMNLGRIVQFSVR